MIPASVQRLDPSDKHLARQNSHPLLHHRGASQGERLMQHGCRRFRACWRITLAVLVAIAGFASNTHGQTSYQVVAAFDPPSSRGANPDGGLVEGSDGSF